jgi:hypothetical protein
MNPTTIHSPADSSMPPRPAAADTLTRSLARCLALLTLAACALLCAAPARAANIEVEGPQDILTQPPAPLSNHCTLRKALGNANLNGMASPYPQCQAGEGGGVVDTITFLFPGAVTLSLAGQSEDAGLTGDLDIIDSVTIIGNPGGTTIDAADLDRVFHINPSNAHPGIVVTLRNITITNGRGPGGAGGILLEGNATLVLENCTVSDNFAFMGAGGGIAMTSGGSGSPTLNMTNTTVSGNSAADFGGGISVEAGTANITNSTVSHNSSNTGLSGGVHSGGTVNLRSSIIAANTNHSMVNAVPNMDGTYVSQGYNVIGDLGSQPANPNIISQPTDQLGVTNAQVNLGPLQNNGGTTLTHELLAGSVAIDKGHSSGSTTDQRELTRPCDLGSVANASGGDGSDAGAFEVQGACAASNQSPVAVDDAASVSEDSGPNVLNVLANDSDPDAESLAVSAVMQGAHGSVSNNGSSVSYTPAANYFGADSFTYTVDDGHGGTDTANVNVNVTAVEDTPDAVDDVANVVEDTGANPINVLSNDADPDGDALSVVAVTQGAHGSVSNDGTSVSYSPAADYFGPDSFTYTVSDGHGGFDTAAVSVSVQNVNDAPVANNDNYSMNQDTTLNVPAATGVLANDTDADADSLQAFYVAGNGPNHGTLTVGAGGSLIYTPDAGFTGIDTFDYHANDGTIDSNDATVTIKVNDTQAPTVNCSVGTALLWPPNSDLVNVGLSVSASDNDGQPPAIQVDVFSDEDDTQQGGAMSPDARDVAANTLRLRAERRGDADGRVYVIRIRATDESNNTSYSYCTVVVPKSRSAADLSAVNAQAAAAVAAFVANGNNPPAGFYVVGDGPTVGPKQ